MIPAWFLYVQGFGMLFMGIALLAMRPRQPGQSALSRWLSLGTGWALLCVAVGVGLLAMALGYLEWPAHAPPPPSRHRRY